MNKNNFQLKLQRTILTHLEKGPDTIKSISVTYDHNYYSVRKAMLSLETQGLVRPTGNSLRNISYALGENPDQMSHIIPSIYDGATKHKLTILLTLRNQSKSVAAEAIVSLPRNIARIFNVALRLKQGAGIPEVSIRNIRHNMELDAQALRRVLDLYEQILKDDRIWDYDYLKRFSKDVDFNEELIREAYNYYFPKDEK